MGSFGICAGCVSLLAFVCSRLPCTPLIPYSPAIDPVFSPKVHCRPSQSNNHARNCHWTSSIPCYRLRASCSIACSMEPRILSPISPSGTILDYSFGSLSFSSTDDSLFPLLSSNDLSDTALFDAYVADAVAKDIKELPMSPVRSFPSSQRSSAEVPLEVSPSQATITPANFQPAPAKLKKKRSLGDALKSLKTASRDFTGTLKGAARAQFSPQPEDTSMASEDLPGSVGLRRVEDEDGFDNRNRTVRRRNMPHHPFRPEDAPYMQAYSQVLLEK